MALVMEQVRLLFPWMNEQLAQVYLDAFVEYGDRGDLAIAEVRNGAGRQVYDASFPGIRRADGTLRMDESTYFSRLQSYRTSIAQRGLDPSVFEASFVNLIEGEVSGAEFESRVSAVNEFVVQQGEQIRQAFAQASGGADFSPEAVLATVLDPDGVGKELLERRISIAQVKGAASEFGFDRTLERAEVLARRDLNLASAREFFGRAQGLTRTLGGIARRFDIRDNTVDIAELEDALVLQEQEQVDRFSRLLSRERASFTPQAGVRRDSRSGGLSGLGV